MLSNIESLLDIIAKDLQKKDKVTLREGGGVYSGNTIKIVWRDIQRGDTL